MDLCIWFTNGATAYFTDADNIFEGEKVLRFSYFGRSSQKQKTAHFLLDKVAGYSYNEKSE